MFRNLTLLNDIKLDATHIISNLIVLNDIKVDITSIFWKLALLNDEFGKFQGNIGLQDCVDYIFKNAFSNVPIYS
jgi:hypothetical protein